MLMRRIETLQRFKGKLLFLWLLVTLFLGMACGYAGYRFEVGILIFMAGFFITCNIIPFFLSAVVWALDNELYNGVRYAVKVYMLECRIRRQLLDAKIYTERKIGAFKVAKLPAITVRLDSDLKAGTIYIENSGQFHDRLGRLDISFSRERYVVGLTYLNRSGSHYCYDLFIK